MKKRRITPYYGGVYWLIIIFMIPGTAFVAYIDYVYGYSVSGTASSISYEFYGAVFVVVILSAIEIIRGFAGSCYTVDEEGMTTYLANKKPIGCFGVTV